MSVSVDTFTVESGTVFFLFGGTPTHNTPTTHPTAYSSFAFTQAELIAQHGTRHVTMNPSSAPFSPRISAAVTLQSLMAAVTAASSFGVMVAHVSDECAVIGVDGASLEHAVRSFAVRLTDCHRVTPPLMCFVCLCWVLLVAVWGRPAADVDARGRQHTHKRAGVLRRTGMLPACVSHP